MTQQMVFDLALQTVQTAIMLIGPALLTAVVAGVAISIFQAVTSIQDMTLTFVPKIVLVSLVIMLLGNWMVEKLLNFTTNIFMSLDKFAG